MKTWDEFVNDGIEITNVYGEHYKSSRNRIIFPNGWIASIVKPDDGLGTYSVAVCDYEGYFWDIIVPFGTENGTIRCNTDDEVAAALSVISNLNAI